MPTPAFLYSVLGVVIGSFLNVCIFRIPRGESIVRPGSRCPHCETPIASYDNLPLLSYLLLRGRCRHCRTQISLRYPFVELLTGLSFYLCALKWDFSPPTFVNSLFLSLIIILVFIDYDHQILPNVLTLPGILVGFLSSPFQSDAFYRDTATLATAEFLLPAHAEPLLPWIGSALGAAAGAGPLLLVGMAYEVWRKKPGLGMGDVKMMAMVGAFLGWQLALLTIFVGSLLGGVVGLFLVAFRGRSLQTALAFGTFLGAGAAVSLYSSQQIIQWYRDIIHWLLRIQ